MCTGSDIFDLNFETLALGFLYIKNPLIKGSQMAEREGFEPSVELPPHRRSRSAP